MQSSTDEIKTRLDIVDFIGSQITLTRAGANFKARCPFHQEKTPSFMVSRPKQMWYCFGCSEGGDIFKFIMKREGMDFSEALKALADKAGVSLPRYDAHAQDQKNTLRKIIKDATDFYAAQLRTPHGQAARDYLTRRRLSAAVIKQFGLGYAPDAWDTLTIALRDKYKAAEVQTAGLLMRRERSAGFYDRFRHRIMFPIRDAHGNAVGFTSRILDEKRTEGKYVNTPETPIYSKGHVLYGLDLARETIRRQDYAVIVEGNMDVIACHQFSMTNVVAASGTALTLDQVRLLKRYTNNLMMAFDADAAGANAARRGIDLALAEGMRVKIITIPPGCGKDPDDCIRKNLTAWEGAVRGAQEIMEYYVSKASVAYPVTTASGRAQFVNSLAAEVRKIPDLVEQDFWIRRIAELARIDEKLLREQMNRTRGRGTTATAARVEVSDQRETVSVATLERKPEISRQDRLSERLLALFITVPAYAEKIIGRILPEMLSPALACKFYTALTVCYTAYNSPGFSSEGADFRQFWHKWLASARPEDLSTASQVIPQTMEDHSNILELFGDKEFSEWESRQLEREANFLISELRREYIKCRRHDLSLQMREAEHRGDSGQVTALAEEFKTLAVYLD